MMIKQKRKRPYVKRNYGWDLGLLALFIGTVLPDFTGAAVHEVLGVVLGAGISVHLWWHRKWMIAMTHRFLTNLSPRPRKIYLLNVLLLISFLGTGVTGVMIASWTTAVPDAALTAGHERLSSLFIILVLIHVVRHGKWLVKMTKTWHRPAAAANGR